MTVSVVVTFHKQIHICVETEEFLLKRARKPQEKGHVSLKRGTVTCLSSNAHNAQKVSVQLQLYNVFLVCSHVLK